MRKSYDPAEKLRHRKLRATSVRIDFLNLLKASNEAVSHSEIQKALNPGLDRVTLYRTIQVLLKKGLIHQAYQEGQEVYYAICEEDCGDQKHHHRHIHFHCRVCHSVTCLDTPEPMEVSAPGYAVEDFEIQAKGVCPSCIH